MSCIQRPSPRQLWNHEILYALLLDRHDIRLYLAGLQVQIGVAPISFYRLSRAHDVARWGGRAAGIAFFKDCVELSISHGRWAAA